MFLTARTHECGTGKGRSVVGQVNDEGVRRTTLVYRLIGAGCGRERGRAGGTAHEHTARTVLFDAEAHLSSGAPEVSAPDHGGHVGVDAEGHTVLRTTAVGRLDRTCGRRKAGAIGTTGHVAIPCCIHDHLTSETVAVVEGEGVVAIVRGATHIGGTDDRRARRIQVGQHNVVSEAATAEAVVKAARGGRVVRGQRGSVDVKFTQAVRHQAVRIFGVTSTQVGRVDQRAAIGVQLADADVRATAVVTRVKGA